jgi:hypothetical protein
MNPNTQTHSQPAVTLPPSLYAEIPRRHDPILAELWEVKAKLNAEAGYDVKRLLADAHATSVQMGFAR